MFRRKDEEIQEELDVMNTKNNANDGNARNGGNYQQAQNKPAEAGGNRSAGGRAPAPAAPAPAYRPQQGGAPAQQRPAASNAAPAERQTPAGNKGSKRVLTVGNDILLKGEIATCDRLVIEGMVDATLKDVHTVEISETGSFKGTAQIEDAEISGLFEGDLIVKNRLTIYSSGKVRGRISYGEIEIERGGQMAGDIKIGGDPFEGKKDNKQEAKKAA